LSFARAAASLLDARMDDQAESDRIESARSTLIVANPDGGTRRATHFI